MSAGVPVIVSRTGGFAETVEDGVTGLLFNPEDVDGLVSCLIRIFQDPVSAMKLSKRARLKVEQDYTWEAVARETACYYRNLTEKAICKEDTERIS
jgi:1,4-alpha-glucan branching enzyme